MNILPFVLTLLLILSVITIEKLERFKNFILVQHQYQTHIENVERYAFNKQQRAKKKDSHADHQQLSFDYFIDKKMLKEGETEKYKQFRRITLDLIKILYGKTQFYKDLEQKRPNVAEELLDSIRASADRLIEDDKIRTIENISRLQLDDFDLQEMFYRMLRGTISKDDLKAVNEEDKKRVEELSKNEKAYVPFLTYIRKDSTKTINVWLAPRELLEAIFESEEIVEAILVKRKELGTNRNADVNSFKSEFLGKQKQGISDDLLDFPIPSTFEKRKNIENYE